MKIAILANDTTYTYNLRKELIERFVLEKHEVVVISTALKHKEDLEDLGCRLINLETGRHGTNPIDDIKLFINYLRILKNEKPGAVLTYNIKPNVYGGMACRLLKIKYIPNITGLGTAVENPGRLQKLTMLLYKLGIKDAYCVFFQNEENMKFMQEHNMIGKYSKTVLLPGSGVSLDTHKPLPYPTDESKIIFLFVARIMKEKGADLYLNAAKKIYETNKRVEFHICGYCDDISYLEKIKQAEAEGYVKYHGEQDNMVPFFEMAHCVVHPSYYPEGMSNVLLEAAAHARPVITTNRAGCKEIVDDRITGYVIATKDENKLINTIFDFLKLSYESKREMGEKGRNKISKQFDRRIIVDNYMKVIGE